MDISMKELQTLVETAYQKIGKPENAQEEIRRIVGFFNSAGEIAYGVYKYMEVSEESSRNELEALIISHLVTVVGLTSFYDMDFDELLQKAGLLMHGQLKEESFESTQDA